MTFSDLCRVRLERHAKSLVKHMIDDCPSLILALDVSMLIDAAEGCMGSELFTQRLRRRIQDLKQRSAYCASEGCDNEINVELSHAPTCEHCDARINADLDRWEKEGVMP